MLWWIGAIGSLVYYGSLDVPLVFIIIAHSLVFSVGVAMTLACIEATRDRE